MYNANDNEQDVLKFWDKTKAFERSVNERPESEPYVFYDGPPFATGLPHYGHIVASVMKDAVPRYYTMQGKRVERKWGWDCHGLPIENIVEKELGTKSKKDIEVMGVDKFNELCRSKVMTYAEGWDKVIYRLGRWVDMKNPYRTMDLPFMESVWWVFKELWDKDYVYQGHRSMHVCPRCETTLSQQEVSEGYKDVKDITVMVRFKVKESFKDYNDLNILAWTTTPWTLPGNTLLAVGDDITYTIVRVRDHKAEGEAEEYTALVAKDLLLEVFDENDAKREFEVLDQVKGRELVGLTYEPLFPYFKDLPKAENAFRVVAADFVEATDGTGVVHLAPAFGTDDYEVFRGEDVPFIQHVGLDGTFIPEVTDFAGRKIKEAGDTMSTDIEIVKYLAHNGLLFKKFKVEHSYPHCWRCDTPLMNYATTSWFVAVEKIKPKALELAKDINWSPGHVKEGRFGMWLSGARDWSISRQRFWASCMPIWVCEQSKQQSGNSNQKCAPVVFGSAQELQERAGVEVSDLHKHVLDEISFPCTDCGGTMTRVPDVLDTWFDSGSMPYGQAHYPFEDKEKFESGFPAEFIAEGQDQTRAWFYYLHVIASAIKEKPAYKNVIVNGIVLAEDGKKMSKKLQNYPDPMMVLEKYGADALRVYLLNSPVMQAESLNFAEDGVREVYNKLVNTSVNVLSFYQLVAGDATLTSLSELSPINVLDKWILARLAETHATVGEGMEAYHLPNAVRSIQDFVTDLSQWYVRRSRDRMKDGEGVDVFGAVLYELSKLLAPFAPFLAEDLYQAVTQKNFVSDDTVHLEMWTEDMSAWSNDAVIKDMALARKAVEMGLSSRKEAKLKVRQPLSQFAVNSSALVQEYSEILAAELNVKEVLFAEDVTTGLAGHWVGREDEQVNVSLCTDLTPELEREGLAREVIRALNGLRKQAGLTPTDRATALYATSDDTLEAAIAEHKADIMAQTKLDSLGAGEKEGQTPVKGLDLELRLV